MKINLTATDVYNQTVTTFKLVESNGKAELWAVCRNGNSFLKYKDNDADHVKSVLRSNANFFGFTVSPDGLTASI